MKVNTEVFVVGGGAADATAASAFQPHMHGDSIHGYFRPQREYVPVPEAGEQEKQESYLIDLRPEGVRVRITLSQEYIKYQNGTMSYIIKQISFFREMLLGRSCP